MADEAIRKAADDLIEAIEAFVDLVVERLPVKEAEKPPMKRFKVRVLGLPMVWQSSVVEASDRIAGFFAAMAEFPDLPRLEGRGCDVEIAHEDEPSIHGWKHWP